MPGHLRQSFGGGRRLQQVRAVCFACGSELEQYAHDSKNVEGGVVGRRVNKQRACLTVDEAVVEEIIKLRTQ